MSGWIMLHRKCREHWLYEERRVFSRWEAWEWMLLEANWEDKKWVTASEVINVPRGSFPTSQVSLSQAWGWSRGKVQQFLKLLEADGMIRQQTSSHRTMITIVNYDGYQTKAAQEIAPEQQQNGSQQAASEQLASTQQAHLNNINKSNNDPTDSTRARVVSSDFDLRDEISLEERAKLEVEFSPSCVAYYLDLITTKLVARAATLKGEAWAYVRGWILQDRMEARGFFKQKGEISFAGLDSRAQSPKAETAAERNRRITRESALELLAECSDEA